MEIILALVVLCAALWWFFFRDEKKIETPVVRENEIIEATVELAPAVVAATALTNVSRFATCAISWAITPCS